MLGSSVVCRLWPVRLPEQLENDRKTSICFAVIAGQWWILCQSVGTTASLWWNLHSKNKPRSSLNSNCLNIEYWHTELKLCGYIFLGIQITPVTQGRVKKGSSDSGVSVPGIEFSLHWTNDINKGPAEPQFLLIIFSQISINTGLICGC